jgi:hypothetical protein
MSVITEINLPLCLNIVHTETPIAQGKFVLPRKGSTSQILLANAEHPALVVV